MFWNRSSRCVATHAATGARPRRCTGGRKARPADHASSLRRYSAWPGPDDGPGLSAFQDGGATRWKGLWIFGGYPVDGLWITATGGGMAWMGRWLHGLQRYATGLFPGRPGTLLASAD